MKSSVIIVNYNGWDDLQRCLASLQDHPSDDSEIIVVDNDSRDGSVEQVAACFPCIRIIRSAQNLGFGGGSNLGAQYAAGEFLAFLNPDTTVKAGWLEALTAALEGDSTAGMVTSRILLMDDPERINTCGNDVHLCGLALCRGMGMLDNEQNHILPVGAVSGAAFAMRKSLFEQLGGFDESFFLYMEDTDLSLRAQLAGYQCLYVPSSVVYHDYQLTFGPQKTFYQERNRYMMLLKNFHWITLLILFPSLLLSEFVTWGYVLWRDRRNISNKLRAYAWIIRHWKQVIEKRKAVQALRKVADRKVISIMQFQLDFGQVGQGLVTSAAQLLFDPLFFILRGMTVALVWW